MNNKEDFIFSIEKKLCSNIQLNSNEIRAVISALRESSNCFQKPYYEVIYHDKFDNTETRIMEPIYSRKIDDYFGDSCTQIQEDHFDLRFRRLIQEEATK